MKLLRVIGCILRLFLLPRSQLVLENLALRQQLAVLCRQADKVYRLAYSPDGKILASGSGGPGALVWLWPIAASPKER